MTKLWWKAAGVRAIKTWAQSIIGSGVVVGTLTAATDWVGVGWTIASVFMIATVNALLSLVTSLAGLPEVKE